MDLANGTLTVRGRADAPREELPSTSFRYVDSQTIRIEKAPHADAGAIYEFVYTAKNPVPAGLAFTGISDLVSSLRGNTGNRHDAPFTGITHTIAVGVSQSDRLLRDMVFQGFNTDEAWMPVFDGMMIHVAGSRKTFTNYRFAQPGRFSRQHEDHDYPGDQFLSVTPFPQIL